MGEWFPNQYYGMDVWKHRELPIIQSHDFSFYRCLAFEDDFYGKTVSELHAGNIRESRKDNRYSSLFPGEKLSYWAESPQTARAEVKKWGAHNNLLTFWAYDDGSSFIPTLLPAKYLTIVDGIHFGFDKILNKVGAGIELSPIEMAFIEKIKEEQPDCLAYHSEARRNGICFLFFEKGFKKLSIREVRLRLGDYPGKNRAKICCAITSDFSPVVKNYGKYFVPLAKVRYNSQYELTEEYIRREQAASSKQNSLIEDLRIRIKNVAKT